MTRSTLTIAKGQNLDTVTGADAREMFSALKGDLPLLSAALYLTELVDSLNPLESPNPPGYSTYLDGLRAIETGNKVDLTLRYLEICLLGQAGFSPGVAPVRGMRQSGNGRKAPVQRKGRWRFVPRLPGFHAGCETSVSGSAQGAQVLFHRYAVLIADGERGVGAAARIEHFDGLLCKVYSRTGVAFRILPQIN